MRALILAAGTGSRLGALTVSVPKPMIPLGGEPVLVTNLRQLVRHGFDEVAINVHHRAEAIERHVRDGAAFGARVTYARERKLLGTAGALRPLHDFFASGTFAVVYGDNRSVCDLDAMLARHRARRAEVTLALWERDDVTASGIVAFGDDFRITRFLEKPRPEDVFSHWVSAGILLCEPAFLARVPVETPSDLGRDVLPRMAGTRHLVAHPMRPPAERLWWIDTPADYDRAASELG